MKRAIAALSCALAGLAVAPSLAGANVPPGLYRCVTPENGRHFANLRILGTDEYRWKGNGHHGRYAVSGRRIHWRTGPLAHIFDGGELLRGQRETLIDLFTGAHPGGRDDIHCRLDH
ncbi:MAG TPA: hypothetical protein VFR97_07690 [Capillimicrobium sp.]|nr:hypothetical protein [Capillimicrobium sp.]